MSRQIKFHSEAGEEYEEALLYYGERSESAALRLEVAVDGCLLRIAEDPKRYSFRLGLRCCRVIAFPYSIYYQENDKGVQIVAVAHQKREPGYWLSRLDDN
jgi:plasmid stabilization system protein ParE